MAVCRSGCSLSRRMHATYLYIVTLLLLQLVGSLSATEANAQAEASPAAAAGERAQTIQPTREAIYQHLATEMKAALGAEEHVQGVFAAVAGGMRDSVGLSVVPALQALVDGVVERAEDAWIDADEAGRAQQVKHCIDGAEGDAQQVAKRALDKIRGCIEAVDEEGQRRSREAARLLNAIEDVSKRFVLALETCIKEEEAKEAAGAGAPSSDSASADPATGTPAACPIAAEDATASLPSEAADNQSPSQTTGEQPEAERNADGKPKCAKCKKSLNNEASAGEAKQGDEATADETTEYKEKKSKGGKEYKGKDKRGKWKKEDLSISEESADVKVSEQSKPERKEKEKSKRGKDGDAIGNDQASDRSGKKYKSGESNADNSAEIKDKKYKKSGKKEEWKGKKEKSGEGSGEEKRGRKKRDLQAFNDATVEEEEEKPGQAQEAEAEGAKAEGATPWPTEGATPEERRVIACLRSATLQPLIDEKTRSYQRLQAVLKRTSVRQEEAPACVAEHVHKAELKVAAIKQRMAACTDRHMRQEL